MVLSQSALARIDAQKQLIDQIIRDPEVLIDGFQALPHTNFLKTNNFVQQTASRLYGKNPSVKKWFPINTDDSGRLLLSPAKSDGAQIFLKDRNFIDDVVMNEISLPNNAVASHVGVNMTHASRKTIAVSSTQSVTVRFQVSNDNANWYTVQNTSDVEFSMNVNNEKVAIEFIDAAHFMRVVIENTSGGTSTVTAVIMSLT